MTKLLASFLLLAAFVCQGESLTEVRLDARDVHHISHEHLGTSIGIAKGVFDKLESCHIIFPNTVMYEVFPNNRIPFSNVFASEAQMPFTGCDVSFRGVGTEFSGTYELLSVVENAIDKSRVLTRQRFNLKVTLPDWVR